MVPLSILADPEIFDWKGSSILWYSGSFSRIDAPPLIAHRMAFWPQSSSNGPEDTESASQGRKPKILAHLRVLRPGFPVYRRRQSICLCQVGGGGTKASIIPSGCKNPFNEFLRTRPPIRSRFYTHTFIYSNDDSPLEYEVDSNLESFLKQVVPLIQE